jgi:hypothetical protein
MGCSKMSFAELLKKMSFTNLPRTFNDKGFSGLPSLPFT